MLSARQNNVLMEEQMKKLLLGLLIFLFITGCGSVERTKNEHKPAQTDKKDKTVAISESEIVAVYQAGKEYSGKTMEFSYQNVADEIVRLYNSGNYREINVFFNENMDKNFLPPEKTEVFCKQVNAGCGKMIPDKKGKKIGPQTFMLPFKCEKGMEMNLVFSLNKENRIQGFWIKSADYSIKYPEITEKTTVEDIVKTIADSPKTAGVVVGAYLNGEEKIYAAGLSSIKSKTPISENMIFEIGSITKTFTSAILLQLEKEGKLELTDPIQKYLPENVKMPTFQGDDTQITFEHISTHFSGLPRMPSNFDKYVKDPTDPYAEYPVEDIYEFLNGYKLTREPGETFEYSNLAVGLLGNLLVKIDDRKNYEELIQERIFKPLKMTSSTTELSKVDKKLLAKPHQSGNETKNWNFPAMAGAGAIKSNVQDILKYLKTLIEGTHPEIINEKLLISQRKIDENVSISYSWFRIKHEDGTETYFHNGATGGYSATLMFDRKNKAGVVILTNDDENSDAAAKKILQILLKKYQ